MPIVKHLKTISESSFTLTPDFPLSTTQQQVLNEITASDQIANDDASMVYSLLYWIGIAEQAQQAITEYGLVTNTESGLKPNPAFAMLRQATERIAKLRHELMLGPRTRAWLAHSNLIVADEQRVPESKEQKAQAVIDALLAK